MHESLNLICKILNISLLKVNRILIVFYITLLKFKTLFIIAENYSNM